MSAHPINAKSTDCTDLSLEEKWELYKKLQNDATIQAYVAKQSPTGTIPVAPVYTINTQPYQHKIEEVTKVLEDLISYELVIESFHNFHYMTQKLGEIVDEKSLLNMKLFLKTPASLFLNSKWQIHSSWSEEDHLICYKQCISKIKIWLKEKVICKIMVGTLTNNDIHTMSIAQIWNTLFTAQKPTDYLAYVFHKAKRTDL